MGLEFPSNFPFHRSPEVGRSAGPVAPVDPTSVEDAAIAPHIEMTAAVARPKESERRRAPRQTLVAKASIRPDSPVHVPSLISAGFVSNISMNGVGFHVRKPLEIGGKYRITLELGPLKWTSRLRVVSCRHHEDSATFDIGGEFIGNELTRQLTAA